LHAPSQCRGEKLFLDFDGPREYADLFRAIVRESGMTTIDFFRSVADSLCTTRRCAETLTAVVFDELRDRLGPAVTEAIAPRLPPGLRVVWVATTAAAPGRSLPYRLELLGEVMRRAALRDAVEAERAVVAVLATLQRLVGGANGVGELGRHLPPDLAFLWREAARVAVAHPEVRRRREPRRSPARRDARHRIARLSA
jgi:uncharacterized protein (DUF2267 family)